MIETYPTSSVSVEYFDTTVMNIPSLFPNIDEDKILRIARIVPYLGAAGLQFDSSNLNLIPAVLAAYDLDYDQVFSSHPEEVREHPGLSIVTSLDHDDIERSIEALQQYKSPLLEILVPSSVRSMQRLLPISHLRNVSDTVQNSFDTANELVMENDDFLLGCSLVDPMDKSNNPKFVDTLIDIALDMYSLEFIDFYDLMGTLEPFDTYDFFMNVFKKIHESSNINVVVSAEFSNDNGLAVANSLYFIKSAIDFARNNKANIKTRVKTSVSNLGGYISGCDIFSLDLAIMDHVLPELKDKQQLIIPSGHPDRTSMAVDIFRILGIDVPITAPVIGYNALKKQKLLIEPTPKS